MNEQEKKPYVIQEHPKFYDFLKHLTTLSTGSIVIIVTFAEKFATNQLWGWLFPSSIVAFLVSMICSVASMFFVLVSNVDIAEELEGGVKNTIIVLFMACMLALCFGVFFLAIFAIRNFIG